LSRDKKQKGGFPTPGRPKKHYPFPFLDPDRRWGNGFKSRVEFGGTVEANHFSIASP